MWKIQDVKYFTGYQKLQIPAVRNCRVTLQDTEHNTTAKENHPKNGTTRFIISKLLYSMNNYDKMNKEILYNNGATLFCVCWGKGKYCC